MSSTPRALRQPLGLKIGSAAFLAFWCLLAAFPIVWITLMSFKSPVDAFAANPFDVILGPVTRDRGNGLSALDLALGLAVLFLTLRLAFTWLPRRVAAWSPAGQVWAGWIIGAMAYTVAFIFVFFLVLPAILGVLNPILGPLGTPIVGLTTEHYQTIWVERGFYNNFINSLIVTGGTVTISLTVGTLAGYGLARSGSNIAFWLLIMALVFRALPHSVLLAGYLPVFVNSAEILRPWLGENAPTLYGQPLAVIAVLVSINQPFTIWMLRSFFQNIPNELDEAARVDGCTHFQAFRWVIMPVMWPGVITTGLFSFLLAYNDFVVTSLLLSKENQTMIPKIVSFMGTTQTEGNVMFAVAAVVSATAPLFVLVMFFQRQIVSGLTAGAVKG
jgi:multiple sugar transport system permease protein